MQDFSFLRNIQRNDINFGDKSNWKEDDPEEVNKVMKEKVKNEKKEVRRYMFKDSEQRLSRRASQVQKIVDLLHRKRLREPAQILGYFNAERINIGKIPLQLYYTLARIKIENSGKLHFSDSMLNSNIYFRAFAGNFVTTTITNDLLYLYLLYSRILKGASNKDDENGLVKMLLQSDIENVMISTKPFILEQENITKGYYQDFSANIAVIGMNGLTENEKNSIINSNKKYEFNIKGVKYIAEGTSDACVIYDEKYTAGVDKAVKDVKTISEFGNFELGPKTIEVKTKYVRYVNATLKPEVFCPAFLKLNDAESFCVLLKMKIDLNAFYDCIEDHLKKKKELFINGSFSYWDSFESYFEFMFVFLLTSPTLNSKGNEEKKETLKKYIIQYIDLKPILLAWKQNQLSLQKICQDYYNSFLGKIRYDKIRSLYKRINSYIDMRNKLLSESFAEVKNFIDTCPFFSPNIRNQLMDSGLSLGDDLYSAIVSMHENNPDQLVQKLRRAGVLIYESGYYPKMDDKDKGSNRLLFPFVLSEGAFLGNLYEGYQAENPIEVNASRLAKNIIERNLKYEEMTDKIYEAVQDNEERLEYIIRENVKNAVGNVQEDVISDLVDKVKDKMSKNEKDKINKFLIKNRDKNINELSYNLNKNSMKPVNDYKRDKEIKVNENQAAVFQEKAKQAESKKKEEDIQEKIEEEDVEMGGDDGSNDLVNYLYEAAQKKTSNPGASRLWADIIIFSGNYGLGEKDFSMLSKMRPIDLVTSYPVDREAIKYILKDHQIYIEPSEIQTYLGSPFKPIGYKYNKEFAESRDKGEFDYRPPKLEYKDSLKVESTSTVPKYETISTERTSDTRYNLRPVSQSKSNLSGAAGKFMTMKKAASGSGLGKSQSSRNLTKSRKKSVRK